MKKKNKPNECKPVAPELSGASLDPVPEKVKSKKTYTTRYYMMILSAAASILGLGLFALYFKTTNIIIGLLGVVLMVTGIFTFRHYWKQEGDISITTLGGKKKTEAFNALVIRRSNINFENVYAPEGFPMQCLNDNKMYYVYIQDEKNNNLVGFQLPDQQYLEPTVFAQRVLGLPAHKKIFERKPKLIQKLKTALLVLAIGIVWLLIMTTTGGN